VTHPIGVICKDAGGANQIASYILHNPGSYLYCLEKPAFDIFRNYLGDIESVTIEEIIKNCETTICGLGINEFEFSGVERLKANSANIICYLDHWVNYRERFLREDRYITPSEIWVSDIYAYDLARIIFPKIPVVLKENYYINDLTTKFRVAKKNKKTSAEVHRLLYLTEPIAREGEDDDNRFNFDEFDALKNFLKCLREVKEISFELRLRLHPSEDLNKYLDLKNEYQFLDSNSSELIEDLVWADKVFGVDTYAMFISDALGVPTYCVSPDPDFRRSIPSNSILMLSTFEELFLIGKT